MDLKKRQLRQLKENDISQEKEKSDNRMENNSNNDEQLDDLDDIRDLLKDIVKDIGDASLMNVSLGPDINSNSIYENGPKPINAPQKIEKYISETKNPEELEKNKKKNFRKQIWKHSKHKHHRKHGQKKLIPKKLGIKGQVSWTSNKPKETPPTSVTPRIVSTPSVKELRHWPHIKYAQGQGKVGLQNRDDFLNGSAKVDFSKLLKDKYMWISAATGAITTLLLIALCFFIYVMVRKFGKRNKCIDLKNLSLCDIGKGDMKDPVYIRLSQLHDPRKGPQYVVSVLEDKSNNFSIDSGSSTSTEEEIFNLSEVRSPNVSQNKLKRINLTSTPVKSPIRMTRKNMAILSRKTLPFSNGNSPVSPLARTPPFNSPVK